MTTSVRAIYSKGVFKPASPISIAEGSEVELTISTKEPVAASADAIGALQRIANLPVEGPADGFSGASHDSVLYPREKR